jgi:hypothetical protein
VAAKKRGERFRLQVIREMLERFEDSKNSGEAMLNVSEYIRLLQMHEDLGDRAETLLKVKWVEGWGEH